MPLHSNLERSELYLKREDKITENGKEKPSEITLTQTFTENKTESNTHKFCLACKRGKERKERRKNIKKECVKVHKSSTYWM